MSNGSQIDKIAEIIANIDHNISSSPLQPELQHKLSDVEKAVGKADSDEKAQQETAKIVLDVGETYQEQKNSFIDFVSQACITAVTQRNPALPFHFLVGLLEDFERGAETRGIAANSEIRKGVGTAFATLFTRKHQKSKGQRGNPFLVELYTFIERAHPTQSRQASTTGTILNLLEGMKWQLGEGSDELNTVTIYYDLYSATDTCLYSGQAENAQLLEELEKWKFHLYALAGKGFLCANELYIFYDWLHISFTDTDWLLYRTQIHKSISEMKICSFSNPGETQPKWPQFFEVCKKQVARVDKQGQNNVETDLFNDAIKALSDIYLLWHYFLEGKLIELLRRSWNQQRSYIAQRADGESLLRHVWSFVKGQEPERLEQELHRVTEIMRKDESTQPYVHQIESWARQTIDYLRQSPGSASADQILVAANFEAEITPKLSPKPGDSNWVWIRVRLRNIGLSAAQRLRAKFVIGGSIIGPGDIQLFRSGGYGEYYCEQVEAADESGFVKLIKYSVSEKTDEKNKQKSEKTNEENKQKSEIVPPGAELFVYIRVWLPSGPSGLGVDEQIHYELRFEDRAVSQPLLGQLKIFYEQGLSNGSGNDYLTKQVHEGRLNPLILEEAKWLAGYYPRERQIVEGQPGQAAKALDDLYRYLGSWLQRNDNLSWFDLEMWAKIQDDIRINDVPSLFDLFCDSYDRSPKHEAEIVMKLFQLAAERKEGDRLVNISDLAFNLNSVFEDAVFNPKFRSVIFHLIRTHRILDDVDGHLYIRVPILNKILAKLTGTQLDTLSFCR